MEFIPKKVFWICLTDPSHDKLIISAVKNVRDIGIIGPIAEVVRLRLNIIEHLTTIIPYATTKQHNGTQELLEGSASTFRRDIVRCLRLTSFLLLNFPLPKAAIESNELIERLIKLISEYLRLLCTVLISKTEQTSEKDNRDLISMFGLYLSIFGSKQPLNHTPGNRTIGDSLTTKDFNLLVSLFQDHISDQHTSVTSQLLETLSVFAANSGSSTLASFVNFHWNATFLSKYTDGVKHKDITGSPFVLVRLLKSLPTYKSQGNTNIANEDCPSYQTIKKLMKHRNHNFFEKHQYLVHSMCRHWSLLALSPRGICLIAKYLNTLLGKLVEYLSDIDDCLLGKKVDSRDNVVFSDDDDDDGEYFPPSTSNTPLFFKPSIPIFSDFVCLTSSSYPVYLDMLMRMTVSSMSLFSITQEMSTLKHTTTASSRFHPVDELERMAIVYGSLMKLYTDKFHIFPKCLQSSVVNISKCMLDVSVTKSQEYVGWRNCQPVLLVEEEDYKGFDAASTTFLKKLLDTFGLHVIGALRTFCCVHSGSTVMQGQRITEMEKYSQFFFAKTAMPGLRSLARKTERTFEFLSQTSNRYNTGEIKTDRTMQHASQRGQDVTTEGFKFHEEEPSRTEQSPVTEELSDKEVSRELEKEKINTIDPSSIRNRGARHSNLNVTVGDDHPSFSEGEESFNDYSDDSSSSRSGAFGVSGDWGQQIDSSEREYDSEFSIDQFQKSN